MEVLLLGFVLLGIVVWLVRRLSRNTASQNKRIQGKTGIVPINELSETLILETLGSGQTILGTYFRQSGEIDRQFECSETKTAIREIVKWVNRIKEPDARIWSNEETFCDVRRSYGSSRGTREGRKIWGIELRIIDHSDH